MNRRLQTNKNKNKERKERFWVFGVVEDKDRPVPSVGYGVSTQILGEA